MALDEVGINLNMQESVTQAAASAGSAIDKLRQSMESLNGSFSPDNIQAYFDAMEERANRRRQEADQARDAQRSFVTQNQAVQAATQIPGIAGNAIGRLGSTGDATGTTGGVLQSAAGLIGRIGPAGVVAGLTVGGIAAYLGGVNAASKPWESMMGQMMDLAMQLGMYGETAGQQSLKFVEAMNRAAEAGSEFGYRIEEAAGLMGALAERGAAGDVGRIANHAMRFARGFGMQPGAMADFMGTAYRFGQGDNALERIAGMVTQQGLGPARFGEIMTAQLSIFEDALARGVVKGFDDIGKMQNMFATAGEAWTGSLGAQRLRQMDQVVSGASSLGREEDLLMYRAARSIGEKDEDYTETMKRLEQGLTPAMFGAIMKQVEGMSGGNRTDMIELLRNIFGVNYTMAENILAMKDRPESAVELLKDAPRSDSYEQRLLSTQEEIRKSTLAISSVFTDDKLRINQNMLTMIRLLERIADVEGEAAARDDAENPPPRQPDPIIPGLHIEPDPGGGAGWTPAQGDRATAGGGGYDPLYDSSLNFRRKDQLRGLLARDQSGRAQQILSGLSASQRGQLLSGYFGDALDTLYGNNVKASGSEPGAGLFSTGRNFSDAEVVQLLQVMNATLARIEGEPVRMLINGAVLTE